MSRSQLKSIGRELVGYRMKVLHRNLLGWPSNLLLVVARITE